MENFPSYQILKHKNGKLIKGAAMCDNCKCACIDCEIKQRALNEQRRIIDQLEADAGKQQVVLGELQTENLAIRTTIAGIYEWMQKHIEVLEKENKRREASILYMSDAGAA